MDSEGNIYEYDRKGVRVGGKNHSWDQCLVIRVTNEKSQMWKDYWDHTLAVLSTSDQWTEENYDEKENNCYSFVITFLKVSLFPPHTSHEYLIVVFSCDQMLQVKQLEPSLTSKMQFCTDFIVPRTKNVAKYIALYRKVIREGVSVISILTWIHHWMFTLRSRKEVITFALVSKRIPSRSETFPVALTVNYFTILRMMFKSRYFVAMCVIELHLMCWNKFWNVFQEIYISISFSFSFQNAVLPELEEIVWCGIVIRLLEFMWVRVRDGWMTVSEKDADGCGVRWCKEEEGMDGEKRVFELCLVRVSAIACLIPCQASEARGFACIYNLREAIPLSVRSLQVIHKTWSREWTWRIKNATRPPVTCFPNNSRTIMESTDLF